jgi:hypothetical protein
MIGYLKEVIEDQQKDSRIANDATNQYQFAHYHAALGHIDKALHWLEKAIAVTGSSQPLCAPSQCSTTCMPIHAIRGYLPR